MDQPSGAGGGKTGALRWDDRSTQNRANRRTGQESESHCIDACGSSALEVLHCLPMYRSICRYLYSMYICPVVYTQYMYARLHYAVVYIRTYVHTFSTNLYMCVHIML